jgi:hypothetical protein
MRFLLSESLPGVANVKKQVTPLRVLQNEIEVIAVLAPCVQPDDVFMGQPLVYLDLAHQRGPDLLVGNRAFVYLLNS